MQATASETAQKQVAASARAQEQATRILLDWVEQQERRDACRQSETARRDTLAVREVAA